MELLAQWRPRTGRKAHKSVRGATRLAESSLKENGMLEDHLLIPNFELRGQFELASTIGPVKEGSPITLLGYLVDGEFKSLMDPPERKNAGIWTGLNGTITNRNIRAVRDVIGEVVARQSVEELLQYSEAPVTEPTPTELHAIYSTRRKGRNFEIVNKQDERAQGEIDGLFECKNRLYVVEAKMGAINTDATKIMQRVVDPLREVYGLPVTYVLMGHHQRATRPRTWYFGKKHEQDIMEGLYKEEVPMIPLNFPLEKQTIETMALHVIANYRERVLHRPQDRPGTASYSKSRIEIYDSHGKPVMSLQRTGPDTWKQAT